MAVLILIPHSIVPAPRSINDSDWSSRRNGNALAVANALT